MKKLINIIILLFVSTQALAADEDPSVFLKNAADKMINAIEANKEKLKKDDTYAESLVREHLLPLIDKESFSQGTLGSKMWGEMTPKQHQEFINGFINRVIGKYAKGIALYDGENFIFEDAEFSTKSSSARVKSSMEQSGSEPLDIYYYLSPDSGSWLITNINVSGTDMRKSYRNQFLPRIKEIGMEKFIEELNTTKEAE
ncbi:MAG: ABC transporter substrate-binding protein [Gammaproteobacteria bacterium]|nr:ABC transporter substrate-binding protein [Gammaproteobacteria bacterium]